jgi:hypothetical protein
MSSMLLMNTNHVHTLADDLESFLHVLSWVALRFTPHGLSTKALTDLLVSMFDHSYEDDGFARGGNIKKNYLIGGEVTTSNFQQEKISTLIKVLTATCAVRYEDPPSDEDLKLYRDYQVQQSDLLQNPHITSSVAAIYEALGLSSVAARYEQKMAALSSSDWMIKTFDDALADRNSWPSDDKSAPNPLVSRGPPGRKRKADDGDVVPEFPVQRMRFSGSIQDIEDESKD